jgi:hypothetical protein
MNMANERAQGQKLIPIPASADFIKELNKGFKKAGYSNRSLFIRDAIIEKLNGQGIKVPAELALAPDRLGKGGPIKYRLNRSNHLAFDEKPSSFAKQKSVAALKKAAASVLKVPHHGDAK